MSICFEFCFTSIRPTNWPRVICTTTGTRVVISVLSFLAVELRRRHKVSINLLHPSAAFNRLVGNLSRRKVIGLAAVRSTLAESADAKTGSAAQNLQPGVTPQSEQVAFAPDLIVSPIPIVSISFVPRKWRRCPPPLSRKSRKESMSVAHERAGMETQIVLKGVCAPLLSRGHSWNLALVGRRLDFVLIASESECWQATAPCRE